VVVEGIETELQACFFVPQVQPILGQGWYFGCPVSVEQFHTLLAENEIEKSSSRSSDAADAA
jgi:sensor c-di-GMP phosphodiesterase-like protein